jgi:hypothetical protein
LLPLLVAAPYKAALYDNKVKKGAAGCNVPSISQHCQLKKPIAPIANGY